MRRVLHAIEIVSHIVSGHIVGWLIMVLAGIVLVEVVTRYVMLAPLMVADEIGGYLVVAIVCMGLAYTWKEGGHIRIEFVTNRLRPRVRDRLRLATLILAMAVTGLLIKASYGMIAYSVSAGVRSHTWMRVPQAWPEMALMIGAVLLFCQLIVEVVKAAKAVRHTKGEAP